MLFASLPSPDNAIGPFKVYGLLLAVGVVLGSAITERRWKRWNHDPGDWQQVVVVTVIFGLIGARLYHVATDYEKFEGNWLRVFEIWKGGLSIWGVVIGGMLGIILTCRVRHFDTLGLMDAACVGLVLAQAIGRWGNWFNQELFGKPTTLPWALEIDPEHRPPGYELSETFHPTFLYESLYNLALLGILLYVERRFRLKRGQLGAIYIMGYTFGRFFLEHLRIDDAKYVLGWRVNAWVSLLAFLAGAAWFWWLERHSSVDEDKYERISKPAAAVV